MWGVVVLESGCWKRGRKIRGYGYRKAAKRLALGDLGEGLVVHHRCFNHWCVNPGHWEILSVEEHNGLRSRALREAWTRGGGRGLPGRP